MYFMTSAFSPLESLLLFQALRNEAVNAISFNRISDQLKSIPLIRNAPDYDGGRLSPDSLRELYLGLLKEEVKYDLEQQQQQTNGDHAMLNGDVSPGSRKRKAASPSLPTVREAAQHSHLIPQLVSRLYTRYRDSTLNSLKSRANQYASIKQDMQQIEAGEWDEKLQRKRAVSETKSPKPSSTAHTQPILARPISAQPSPLAVASPAAPVKPVENGVQVQAKRYTQAKIDTMINHGPEPQNSPGGHRRTSSNTILPPLSEMAPQSPHFGVPPQGTAQPHMQPLPHASSHGYTHSPPASAGNQSPYAAQHGHPRPGSMASPQLQQSLSRPSSSPRPVLPPPKGMQFAPPPPVGPHTGSPSMHAPPLLPQQHHPPPPPPQQPYQQGRMPPNPYKTDARYPATPVAPQQSGYYTQQQPYVDRRTSYPPPQGPQTPTYQPQPGGYMLPPFQIQPQDPSKPMPPQQMRQQHPPAIAQRPPNYPHHTPIAPSTAPRPSYPQHPQMSMVVNALATPLRSQRRPKGLWKSGIPFHGEQSPKPRPVIEPLSPKLERAKLPSRLSTNRSQESPAVEAPAPMEAPPKGRGNRRRTNARDRSPHSVVSSTADDSLRARTRSHSVSTVAGKDDRPASRNGVKAEPSTPADMEDAPSAASGVMTRKRRGTLQSSHAPPSKRKRNDSPPAAGEDTDQGEPPPRSNTVTATRNFAKMSSAIMNDITSHKHASYFAKEVRDKDAPGYSDIVKQPQNLKSIRSAITAGARAIAAASTSLDSPSATPTTSSTTVELERSVDLIPPKAIVNGAQLEKELMRMLANAYMFNPGEDGMALTTKEFFEDVEQKITDWRGTEREAGGDEDDDGKKRRKV